MTHHHAHSSHNPWKDLPDDLAQNLELEATLNQPLVDAVLERAAGALNRAPETIIDLGSGTGAGTIALARKFPDTRVHALDVSATLLDRVKTASREAGVAERVDRHEVDLSSNWPALVPGDVDLIWSSLTLHHLPSPEQVLQQIFESLRPGGLLVLTELTGETTFKPAGFGLINPGQDHHAGTDWQSLLEGAGFSPVDRHDHDFLAQANTPEGARYLGIQLRSRRHQLGQDLDAEDLAGLDAVIESLEHGTSSLSMTSGRAVWVAARPLAEEAEDAEVAVVGGGSAGLAAAIVLARSRRNVVVIDAGQPRNSLAEAAHNVLGNEGIAPLDLLAKGRAEAEFYGVRILPGKATGVSGGIDDFTLEVDGGAQHVRARRLILASGLIDDLPDIPGVQDGWGTSVLHCPFCHGWEVRDQRIAILSRDEVAIHQVLLFRQLSEHVTVFLHEAKSPTAEQQARLSALGVELVRSRVEKLGVDGSQVRSVELADGRSFSTDAVVIAPRFHARTELYEALGGVAEETPFGTQIPTDPRGMTEVPGVWAAGNASQIMAMVQASAASGVTTGSAVHGDLAFADLL